MDALRKWGNDTADPNFRQAIQHYHAAQGSGEPGNPHNKHWRCSVWCDASPPYLCEGQPRVVEEFRGVNYGGRFVPERYLGLPGTSDLFFGVEHPKEVEGKPVGSVSLCDVGQQAANANARMSAFLDVNIKPEHFSRMAALGYNVVRLPLGYWNLIDLPGAATPNGLTPQRWFSLQHIMPAEAYSKWIRMVFEHAGRNGLRVLLDFHGAPGGQTGNAFTGCDTGKGSCNFDTEWNKELAVRAVKKMAQLCKAYRRACYGIELLNEPAFGRTDLRPFLRDYYKDAIKVARQYLDKNTPLVIMDWTKMLPWWKKQKPFSYHEYGRVIFSTHMYDGFGVYQQNGSRRAFYPDLSMVEDFFIGSKYEVIVSEYSLSGHGSGNPKDDSFDYHSLANWLVHQISQRSLGSAVWNYDAAVDSRVWGPVAHDNLGKRPIRWKDIFESGGPRPEIGGPRPEIGGPRPAQEDARLPALHAGAEAPVQQAPVQVLADSTPGDDSILHGLLSLLPTWVAVLALLAVCAALGLAAWRSLGRGAPQGLRISLGEAPDAPNSKHLQAEAYECPESPRKAQAPPPPKNGPYTPMVLNDLEDDTIYSL